MGWYKKADKGVKGGMKLKQVGKIMSVNKENCCADERIIDICPYWYAEEIDKELNPTPLRACVFQGHHQP